MIARNIAGNYYELWRSMVRRCRDPRHTGYANYGGRGIDVDDKFLDYIEFYNYMGPRPKGKSLDRIDDNKGYVPGNIRWADSSTQNINRRKPVNNTSGYIGVTRRVTKNGLVNYEVNIQVNSVPQRIGSFKCT